MEYIFNRQAKACLPVRQAWRKTIAKMVILFAPVL